MTKQVNHFIREWRNHRGHSVRTLAKAAGLAPSTIGGLESGNAQYSQSSLESIAKALGTTPGALLSGKPLEAEDLVPSNEGTSFARPSVWAPSNHNAMWRIELSSQRDVAIQIFREDVDRAVERATTAVQKAGDEMFKKLAKELRKTGWTDHPHEGTEVSKKTG